MPSESDKLDTVSRVPAKDITIREFERGDLEQLPGLLRETLGRYSTSEWLEWKFFHNPYSVPLRFFVATYQDDLVGFIGANPVPYSADGELSHVYQHQDVAIREDCRSLRLLRTMTEACERDAPPPGTIFSYSLTPPHMRALVTKRLGYKPIWESLKLAKLTSLRAYVSKATRSARLASILPGPLRRSSWKAPASMTGDITEIDRFGPEFDEFWSLANAPGEEFGRIFAWQDSAWLQHKFCEDSIVPFRRFAYTEAGKTLGYCVLNVTSLDVRIGYIDALWTVPGRTDIVDLLADFACTELIREGCDHLASWTRPEVPLGSALVSRGFVRRPTNMCLSVKHLVDGYGEFGLHYEHWNLQRGHTYYTSIGHLGADEGKRFLYKAREEDVARRRGA
ncbi:MAG: hypothetical protein ACF8PN_02770 [Phycisphaerales bacterium]